MRTCFWPGSVLLALMISVVVMPEPSRGQYPAPGPSIASYGQPGNVFDTARFLAFDQSEGPVFGDAIATEATFFSPTSTLTREADLAGAKFPDGPPAKLAAKKKEWYDKIGVRGFAQFRYNDTVGLAPGSAPPQHAGDPSISPNQGFLIRQARLIISGDITDRVFVYLQPDFASNVPGAVDGANQFVQLRDCYGDLYLTTDKVHRFRVGQSKVPYGWENLQSVQNRIPLDRADSLGNAARYERGLGVFYYWTPVEAQGLFKRILDEGLKGTGNYGIFGFGAYNGQGGSTQEQNDQLHLASRLTLPFVLPNGQIMEVGMQGYTGKYVVPGAPILPMGVGPAIIPAGVDGNGITDQRLAWSYVIYPQPLGFQAEWTIGRGPGLNDSQTAVIERDLNGGYAMLFYKIETERRGKLFPYVRYSYYQGGYKPYRNAPYTHVNEWEFGCEWQLNKAAELTLGYLTTDRTNLNAMTTGKSYQQFDGDVVRAQLQINY